MIDTPIDKATDREIVAACLLVPGIILACFEGASVWPQIVAAGLLFASFLVMPDGDQ